MKACLQKYLQGHAEVIWLNVFDVLQVALYW